MPKILSYSAAALLVLCTAAAFAPTATADTCNGVVLQNGFTGACTINNCASSPTGFGIVVYVNGNPGRCIGIAIN